MALKASSEALTADQKRIAESKRNIIILIYHYLLENGYVESAERVQKEGGAVMTKFEVADNIDLSLILSEYEAYYEMRFEKKPKLVRKSKDDDQITAKAYRKAQETKKTLSRKSNSDLNDNGSVVLPTLTNSTNGSAQEDSGSLNIQGVTCVNEKSKRPESDDKIEER
jgi:katanin p60 ATPase-containing subunit A1